MPKQTFFNLPAAKQERLLDAARTEFSKMPVADVSISNIIRLAQIPRGSFYQYFEDKEDLYFYLIGTQRNASNARIKRLLEESHGDFFKAMTTNFELAIDDLVSGPDAALFRQAFLHMSYHGLSRMAPGSSEKPAHHSEHHGGPEFVTYMFQHTDLSQLRVENEQEFLMLLGQTMGIYFQTVSHFLSRQAQGQSVAIDDLKRRIHQQLRWLQYGVSTNKGGSHV